LLKKSLALSPTPQDCGPFYADLPRRDLEPERTSTLICSFFFSSLADIRHLSSFPFDGMDIGPAGKMRQQATLRVLVSQPYPD
jgi:hypothetical protein